MRKTKLHTTMLGTALILSMGITMSAQAADNGWKQESGNWAYYENGSRVTNEWKKSSNYWFYLDSEGYMAKDSLIDNRYVNEDGAMITNAWRKIYTEGEDSWYYFTQNGYMSEDGWKTINNKKYHFDSDGTMDYGWFEDNQYYLGSEDDGAMKTGWAFLPSPEDSDSEHDDSYYYFSSTGKITRDSNSKKINGYTYSFDEDGRMLYGWVDVANKVMAGEENSSSDIKNYQYFKNEQIASGIDGSRLTGWKQMDPPDSIHSDADETPWYYFKDGVPYSAAEDQEYVLKSIKSKKYCFNPNGEMQYGFQYLTDSGSNLGSSSNAAHDDGADLYYFGAKNEGSMKTGAMTLYNEDDGEKHTYFFSTNGKGYTGQKSDALYFKGKRLDADKDLKYQIASVGDITRLVNTTGKIQKASSGGTKEFTDGDGRKIRVNGSGEVVSEITGEFPVITE